MKHRTIVSALLLSSLYGSSAIAQELNMMSKFASGKPICHVGESEIPFRLLRHRIAIPVFLNGKPDEYVFVLDTGALTFITEPVAEALGLEKGQAVPTLDKDETAYLTKLESIRIGDMEVNDLIVPRMDFQAVFDSSFVFHGFIGSDFLRFFRVVIDYQHHRLTLSQPFDSSSVVEGHYRIPMETPFPMRFPYIDITANDSVRTRAMLDTGSPFAVVLPLSFEREFCDSVGNQCIKSAGTLVKWPSTDPPYNCLLRLNSLLVGSLLIRNLPAILTDLPMMVSSPLLGKGFLDRYVVELDFPSGQLTLTPVTGLAHDTNLYSTGFGLKKMSDGSVVVSGYWEGSPASRSGVRPGDRIVELNGVDVRSVAQEDIDALLEDSNIDSIHLGLKRDEGIEVVTIQKEWLLRDSQTIVGQEAR